MKNPRQSKKQDLRHRVDDPPIPLVGPYQAIGEEAFKRYLLLGQAPDAGIRAALTRRVGSTAKDRLARVLVFLEQDLSVLREGEVEAWGDDLRFITLEAQPLGMQSEVVRGRLTREALQKLQGEIKTGLEQLYTTGQWALPRPEEVWLGRSTSGELYIDTRLTSVWSQILWGVVTLARQVSQQLKACPTCGRLFVQRGRQGYCRPQCSVAMRDRKKTKR